MITTPMVGYNRFQNGNYPYGRFSWQSIFFPHKALQPRHPSLRHPFLPFCCVCCHGQGHKSPPPLFFLLLFVILVATKGLCLRNHLQALIPTPIFIWDISFVFCTQYLEDKVFLMGQEMLGRCFAIGVVIILEAVIVVIVAGLQLLQ